jgi:structure-specific recognition protein 1
MQGAQYSFRVPYTNIEIAYMLMKTEKDRVAFVLQLASAIRQGNQKYKSLVLETHGLEETIEYNLPVEVLTEQYGITEPSTTNTLSNIFGKVLKSIAGVKVLIPKFSSSTESRCIRCSIKANDGYLFPAAKCFIFITKPTIIINFDDIESIEFLRYDNTKNAGMIKLKLASSFGCKLLCLFVFCFLSSSHTKLRHADQDEEFFVER